ncbi:hypothetical protein TCAL_02923 [Tigriopus californicus]|uniref:Uncharacterized protein n=1 Tax=Tigriopus californicus TaxID=6832 RepID=A0A553NQR9_TIGCA|nr:uncharacterized protein LOC131879474 [Tigriopus californicus]TRY67781.1 hypothetical protein TCAL_02923 [Tigriopus californicus]|eukprot:TCALIF_02923-PA protein Name:"Protein of unknown function" AED:0.00 eAED:0.00 QI:56/1/1/1/1/1/4/139/153
MSDIEIEFSPTEEFGFWLDEMEDKSVALTKKPSTRVEACQLLASTQSLKENILRKEIPKELLEIDEDDTKLFDLVDRYNALREAVEDQLSKAETLSSCWNKLNSNMSELSRALSAGGANKLTVEKLETSLNELKEMFKERATIMENLTPGGEC